MTPKSSKVIVALDFSDEKSVLHLVDRLQPQQCRLKIGKELFTRLGPAIVEKLAGRGFDIFLDMKYHDIPNTVARACVAAANTGVWMLNVHALGGRRMMAAAREALDNLRNPPLLIAVTVLTSMEEKDLREIGIMTTPALAAENLAGLAEEAGLDGIVCSAQEAEAMRTRFGQEFVLVTPGIRLAGDASADQRRIMTPVDAIKAGSDYLVIGRSITHSDDPLTKLQLINAEIASCA
jgi:orotidine-5'-phosphate decarboxylase